MYSKQRKSKAVGARERILLTAHNLFYQEGVRATGIDRVIAESGVAKATFYRHFPSKHDLVREFLNYRHQHWIDWFAATLQGHGGSVKALCPTMAEWFRDKAFRGCAFINIVAEMSGEMPEVIEITRAHKQEMTDTIAGLLPPSRQRKQLAQALALAVDGAIVRAQFDPTPNAALSALDRLCKSLVLS